jgi:glutaredoxin
MNFTIYSKDGCPYCTKIEQLMKVAELNHVVYKLGEDYTREEFYNQFGVGSTFPQVLMGEKQLGGCTETARYLKENKIIS